MGDQLEVAAIDVAAPDGAGPAVGVVACSTYGPFRRDDCRPWTPTYPDGEPEFAVGAGVDAVDVAVVVVEAAEAAQEFLRRPVAFQSAFLVFEDQNVGRLTDEDSLSLAVGIGGDGDAERGDDLLALVEDVALVGLARAGGVLEDDDAIAFGPQDGPVEVDTAIVVDGLADPNAAFVVDVDGSRD